MIYHPSHANATFCNTERSEFVDLYIAKDPKRALDELHSFFTVSSSTLTRIETHCLEPTFQYKAERSLIKLERECDEQNSRAR